MLEAAQAPFMALIHVDPTELRILTKYREASLAGKRLIEDIVDSAPRPSSDDPH